MGAPSQQSRPLPPAGCGRARRSRLGATFLGLAFAAAPVASLAAEPAGQGDADYQRHVRRI